MRNCSRKTLVDRKGVALGVRLLDNLPRQVARRNLQGLNYACVYESIDKQRSQLH